MFGWYLYSDQYYMFGTSLVLFASLLGLYAQGKVQSNYTKYKRVLTLPLYADLDFETVDKICKIILSCKK